MDNMRCLYSSYAPPKLCPTEFYQTVFDKSGSVRLDWYNAHTTVLHCIGGPINLGLGLLGG